MISIDKSTPLSLELYLTLVCIVVSWCIEIHCKWNKGTCIFMHVHLKLFGSLQCSTTVTRNDVKSQSRHEFVIFSKMHQTTMWICQKRWLFICKREYLICLHVESSSISYGVNVPVFVIYFQNSHIALILCPSELQCVQMYRFTDGWMHCTSQLTYYLLGHH